MTAFIDYFKGIYGERWDPLYRALLQPHEKVSRECFSGHATYVMDRASIRAALALEVAPGDRVLDLCAAPGGKALILAEGMGPSGTLIANELSSQRRRRLKEVIDHHVPASMRSAIQITGFDGNEFGLKRENFFDRVLLDAPCSSERHLIEEDPEVNAWKESRTRQLAMRQYSLLCSGLLALKPGGKVVYSTCSISPVENDRVVERVLKKKSEWVALDLELKDVSNLERTEFGFEIFPDHSNGEGPIYFSRLTKIK